MVRFDVDKLGRQIACSAVAVQLRIAMKFISRLRMSGRGRRKAVLPALEQWWAAFRHGLDAFRKVPRPEMLLLLAPFAARLRACLFC